MRIAPFFPLALLLLTACGSGGSDENLDFGMWKEFRGGANLDPAESAELREKLSAVQSLGYLDGVKPAEGAESSVTYVDPERAWPGYNISISGGEPEAVLMDMLGHPLHRWRLHLDEIWTPEVLDRNPELKAFVLDEGETIEKKDSWQRALLRPGGDMIVLFKDIGVARIDRDSNLIWKRTFGAHHDLAVSNEGEVFVLISEPRLLPRIDPEKVQLDDFVVVLSPEGEERRRYSIYDALNDSPFSDLINQCEPSGDPFHTNSIQILETIPETTPPLPEPFKPGALLLSVREIDMIGLLDPESGLFTWTKTGPWIEQHHPTLLDTGTITVFDNFGNPEEEFGESRVVEYDPVADRIVWQYGGTADNFFGSRRRGNVQRLPNGNTLINESDNGRAFEITRDGEIVWEYINPHRAGEDDRYIAVLRTFERIDPASVSDWLEHEEAEAEAEKDVEAEELNEQEPDVQEPQKAMRGESPDG